MMNKNNEIVKVSDWSQKYKLVIYAFSGVGMIFGFYKIYLLLVEVRDLLQLIYAGVSVN